MGLDSFKTKREHNPEDNFPDKASKNNNGADEDAITRTKDDGVEANKEITALKIEKIVKESDGRLQYIINNIIEDRLWPTKKEWNELRDDGRVNISTRAGNLKPQCGFSLSQLHCLIGAHPSTLSHTKWSEQSIDASLNWIHELYGDDFNQKDLTEINWAPSCDSIENITGKSYNEKRIEMGIGANITESITEDKVKHQLENLCNSQGIPIREKDVSSSELCDFTSNKVRSVGDGSFINGLERLGIEVTNGQRKKKKSMTNNDSDIKNAREMLNRCDGYEENADGYVYLLECERNIDETVHLYVGETQHIVNRIRTHISVSGDFSGITKEKTMSSGVMYDIEVIAVNSIHSDDIEVDLDKRLKFLEGKKHRECVKNFDKPVLGN